VVIDNIFGAEWTNALRSEIRLLFDMSKLYNNRTYYEGKKSDDGKFTYGYSVMKPNVHELDLLQTETRKDTPYLQKLYEDTSMIEHINALFPLVNLNCLDIKVQLNTGAGGCFPMHFDTTQKVSDRQITGTLYLNPNWMKGDGGELRVYPFPYDMIDIEPVNDRLVLFSSHQTLHRVLPFAGQERYCITLWFSGQLTESIFPTFSWLRSVEGIGFLLNPTNRKSLSKFIYEQDWADSVTQSFGKEKAETQKVLESHKRDVETIRSQLSPSVMSFVKDCLPLGHDDHFKQHIH